MTCPPPPPASDTRDRLLEAARTLFWRQGYNATGVAQILKEAEANSGSLSNLFPTKEGLLLAVLERYKDLLWPIVVGPVYGRVADPVERIFGVLDGYRRGLQATDCAGGCPIGNLALELSDSHPAARRLIAENFENWISAVEQCIETIADRLPPDVDRRQLASFVLTVMEGGMMQARAHRSIAPFESAVAQLRDYFERLLRDGGDWSAPREPKRETTKRAAAARKPKRRSHGAPR